MLLARLLNDVSIRGGGLWNLLLDRLLLMMSLSLKHLYFFNQRRRQENRFNALNQMSHVDPHNFANLTLLVHSGTLLFRVRQDRSIRKPILSWVRMRYWKLKNEFLIGSMKIRSAVFIFVCCRRITDVTKLLH